jgi:branched-chain amino acid transport system ATP-binding protein
MSAILEVSDVSVHYGKAVAVQGAGFELESGTMTALLGPNGAGKSSLFNAVAGVVPMRSGKVLFEGEEITSLTPTARARRGVVLVPQGRQLFPRLTVLENLQVVADALRCDKSALDTAMDRFPILRDRAGALAGVLSGGEQQMLVLARGLMSRPRVLMLDEPTLGLAPSIVSDVMRTVSTLAGEGIGVVIAEPSTRVVVNVATRGSVMIRGRIAHRAETMTELEAGYRELMGAPGATH